MYFIQLDLPNLQDFLTIFSRLSQHFFSTFSGLSQDFLRTFSKLFQALIALGLLNKLYKQILLLLGNFCQLSLKTQFQLGYLYFFSMFLPQNHYIRFITLDNSFCWADTKIHRYKSKCNLVFRSGIYLIYFD